jgi:hypothetical protein
MGILMTLNTRILLQYKTTTKVVIIQHFWTKKEIIRLPSTDLWRQTNMEKLVLTSIEGQILVKLCIGCRRQTRHK